MNLYMHTIDGHIGFYDDVEKLIFFAGHKCDAKRLLVKSLPLIRHQQAVSRATRTRSGQVDEFKYDYFLVQSIEAVL